MSIILELKPEIERGLLARAQARGVSLQDFAQEILTREAEPTPTPQGRIGLDPADDVAIARGVEKGGKKSRLLEVCAMVRGLTDDADFSRNPSTGRPVDLP